MTNTINRNTLTALLDHECIYFEESHPKSRALFERARAHLLTGTPMPWMREWQSPFAVFVDRAVGSTVVDVDGNEYADFCLGDTGAMFGHSPEPFLAMTTRALGQGITHMLPTEDSIWLAAELSRRFGLQYWSFALTATDANRFACRFAREHTGRPKILVFDGCYHGTLGETLVDLQDNHIVRRSGAVGIFDNPETTTRVVDFNDPNALETELSHGDVACVLTEPVLTNCGMVFPEPGFHKELRRLTRRQGTLLIIDETHTFSCGPAGYTGAFGLDPDMLTLGKPIAAGIPAAIYGFSGTVGERAQKRLEKNRDFSTGIGGTLAANAFSVRVMRVMLEDVITPASYGTMFSTAALLESAIKEVIERYGLPWHVSRLGARVEYGFNREPWKNSREVKAGRDPELERYLHLFCLNRGVFLTPFHNMLLTAPTSTEEHVQRHNQAFEEAVQQLLGKGQ